MSNDYQTIQTQPISPQRPPFYQDPQVWMIAGGFFLIGLIKLSNLGIKRQVIGRARWATRREIRASSKKAYGQVIEQKLSQPALWINEPKGLEIKDGNVVIPFDSSTLFIPDVGTSVSVWAGSDAGKTYGLKDPLMFSAIYQGHSLIDFDAKANENPPPSVTTIGHALKNEYDVWILDPTGDDTDSFNVWKAISHEQDTDSAIKLGDSFVLNMGLSSEGGNAGFFNLSGGTLLAAIFLLIKSLPEEYQDFATFLKIISLPNLIERVSINSYQLNEYVKGLWAQFLSLAKSEETAQGVIGTATLILGRVFTPEINAVFRGDGNCPAILNGRQMVVFRMNPDRIGQRPVIAAAMEIMHRRSLYQDQGRTNHLGLWKDECPQLRYNKMSNNLNLQRSLGGYCVHLGQGRSAMSETHSDKETEAIISGSKIMIFGGMKGNEDTEYFSKSLCEEQVKLEGKSKSFGSNKSRTRSENAQTARLMYPHEVKGMQQGLFVFEIPAVGFKQGSRPFKQNVRISKLEKKRKQEARQAFNELRKKRPPRPLTDQELRDREDIAYRLLPLPEDEVQVQNVNAIINEVIDDA